MPPGSAQQTTGQPSFSSITSLLRPSSVQTSPTTFIPSSVQGATLTNLGPITTLFTPPLSCFQTTTSYSDGILWWMNGADGSPGDCWPTVAGGNYAPTVTSNYNGQSYYSPAVCPSGWVTAQTIFSALWNLVAPSVSVFACCPFPGISMTGIYDICILTIPSGAVLTNVLSVLDTTSAAVNPTSTLTASNLLYATAMVVLWELSDLAAQTQISSSATPTRISSPTTQSSSASTSSPGNTTGSTSSSRISTGAKAGIAVGIVALFILIVLTTFFYFRRRGKIINGTSGEKPLKPNAHELITTSNTHEMSTKHNVPEMDEQNSGKPNPAVAAVESQGQQETLHELDPASHITSLISHEQLPSPQEFENSAAQSLAGLTTSAGKRVSETTDSRSTASVPVVEAELAGLEKAVINEKEEQRLQILKDRIERIRAEKERLTRIQELEALEEETKREILDTQRRVDEGGGASGS